MTGELPPAIRHDLADLLRTLAALGFIPQGGSHEATSFGDYDVEFTGASRSFRIVRDRGQYYLEGDRDALESAGLWRAFDEKTEFAERLVAWLRASG